MEDINEDKIEIPLLENGQEDPSPSDSSIGYDDSSCDEEERLLIKRAAREIPEIKHTHYADRLPWLRAAVLGANDGLVTIGGVMFGMTAAVNDRGIILLSAASAILAGGLSMACGEYVSIAAQRDSERAEEIRERSEFKKGKLHEVRELLELADLFVKKGVTKKTALKVAREIHGQTQNDLQKVIKVHLKEELNMEIDNPSNPVLAALSSSTSFMLGGSIPLLMGVLLSNNSHRLVMIAIACLLSFVLTGMVASYLSGARLLAGVLRMIIGGTVKYHIDTLLKLKNLIYCPFFIYVNRFQI